MNVTVTGCRRPLEAARVAAAMTRVPPGVEPGRWRAIVRAFLALPLVAEIERLIDARDDRFDAASAAMAFAAVQALRAVGVPALSVRKLCVSDYSVCMDGRRGRLGADAPCLAPLILYTAAMN